VTTYADEDALAAWLEGTPYEVPENPGRVLVRASEVIADWTIGQVLLDGEGIAVDPNDRAALTDATCAQVEQWCEVGEENDIAGYPDGTTMALGAGAVTHLPPVLAPRAARILRRAGVTVVQPGAATTTAPLTVELV